MNTITNLKLEEVQNWLSERGMVAIDRRLLTEYQIQILLDDLALLTDVERLKRQEEQSFFPDDTIAAKN
jgi:TorA maturation chaperone TorD